MGALHTQTQLKLRLDPHTIIKSTDDIALSDIR